MQPVDPDLSNEILKPDNRLPRRAPWARCCAAPTACSSTSTKEKYSRTTPIPSEPAPRPPFPARHFHHPGFWSSVYIMPAPQKRGVAPDIGHKSVPHRRRPRRRGGLPCGMAMTTPESTSQKRGPPDLVFTPVPTLPVDPAAGGLPDQERRWLDASHSAPADADGRQYLRGNLYAAKGSQRRWRPPKEPQSQEPGQGDPQAQEHLPESHGIPPHIPRPKTASTRGPSQEGGRTQGPRLVQRLPQRQCPRTDQVLVMCPAEQALTN